MDLNNKRKKYNKIYSETGSAETFVLLDEINSDLEDYIDNLMNDSNTDFVLEKSRKYRK